MWGRPSGAIAGDDRLDMLVRNSGRRRRAPFAIFMIAAAAALGGVADAATQQVGGLTVRVVDQTGGVLPHATIVIRQENAGSSQPSTVVSDAAGVYEAAA